MINYILLVLTVIFSGLRSVFSKIGNRYLDKDVNIYSFNFLIYTFGLVLILAIGAKDIFPLSPYVCLMALLYAACTMSSQVFFIKAVSSGDVALSSLFYSCGFLVPTILGTVLYHETVTFVQIIGIAVLLVSFLLCVQSKQKQNLKWLIYAVTAMLSSGVVGLIQKIFRMSAYKGQSNGFLAIAFILLVIVTFILMPKRKMPPKPLIGTGAIIGLCYGGCNIINTFLSGVLPSTLLFPFINGGSIVASSVLARLTLKEKLSKKKWFSIALGLAGILIVAFG